MFATNMKIKGTITRGKIMIAGTITKTAEFNIYDIVRDIRDGAEYIIEDKIKIAGSVRYYISNFRHTVCSISEYEFVRNFKKIERFKNNY